MVIDDDILAYFTYIFDKEMVSSETNNNFRAKMLAFDNLVGRLSNLV